MIEVRGASKTIYVLKDGQLDERALLAFSRGQCHGLALAVQERTGWPLVAIYSPKGVCEHICVQRPDSLLIDVTGAHTKEEVEAASPGCTIDPISDIELDQLVSHEGWALPATEIATAWVEAVLDRARKPPQLPPRRASLRRQTRETDALRVRVEWEGHPYLRAFIQRIDAGESQWTPYSVVQLPIDPGRDAHVIDFSEEEFKRLSDAWLERQFDLEKALAKLSMTG